MVEGVLALGWDGAFETLREGAVAEEDVPELVGVLKGFGSGSGSRVVAFVVDMPNTLLTRGVQQQQGLVCHAKPEYVMKKASSTEQEGGLKYQMQSIIIVIQEKKPFCML